MNKLEYDKYTLEEYKDTLKKYVHELIELSDFLYAKMDKNKEIIDRLKKMCRERTREINCMYHGGFSSREQCNFDGQLEIMKEIMQMTDRRKNI